METKLDQWHVVPGDQLPAFMEEAIRENDFVLIVCTPEYKKKSEGRRGGVGYEGDIMTAEVLQKQNHRKFIPVLREGDWATASPAWLSGKYYVDLRGSSYDERHYQDLLATLLGTREDAPPVRAVKSKPVAVPQPPASRTTAVLEPPGPIRIVGIVIDEVTQPRNDGTRGSALYAIPFRLSRRPSSTWADAFIECWNHPPRYTSMHRPGIASVHGDKIILDGTTMEEVERDHRDTLQLCVDEANQVEVAARRKEERQREEEKQRQEEHRRKIEDVATRIRFEGNDDG